MSSCVVRSRSWRVASRSRATRSRSWRAASRSRARGGRARRRPRRVREFAECRVRRSAPSAGSAPPGARAWCRGRRAFRCVLAARRPAPPRPGRVHGSPHRALHVRRRVPVLPEPRGRPPLALARPPGATAPHSRLTVWRLGDRLITRSQSSVALSKRTRLSRSLPWLLTDPGSVRRPWPFVSPWGGEELREVPRRGRRGGTRAEGGGRGTVTSGATVSSACASAFGSEHGNAATHGWPSSAFHGLWSSTARMRCSWPSATAVKAGRMKRRPRTPNHRPRNSRQASPASSKRSTSKLAGSRRGTIHLRRFHSRLLLPALGQRHARRTGCVATGTHVD